MGHIRWIFLSSNERLYSPHMTRAWDYSWGFHSLLLITRKVMMVNIKLLLVLSFDLSVGIASLLRSPSKEMMNNGYEIQGSFISMNLKRKGIAYIPERTFRDFPNVTVSLCDYIVALISWYSCHFKHEWRIPYGHINKFLICKRSSRIS